MHIVTYSYLILPLSFLISKNKKKDIIPLTLAVYGILFFGLLISYDYLPKSIRAYYKGFYTLLEFMIFAFLFWKSIKSSKAKQFIFLTSLLFIVFQIIYVLTTKVKHLDTIPIGIETILIFIYIFLFFYEFARNTNNLYIYSHYCFWIAGGILIYLGGSFFFFILIEHLSDDQLASFGNLTYLAEVIKNLLFTLAIFIYIRYPSDGQKNKPNSVPFLDMI